MRIPRLSQVFFFGPLIAHPIKSGIAKKINIPPNIDIVRKLPLWGLFTTDQKGVYAWVFVLQFSLS
jgi:hypothetical protein